MAFKCIVDENGNQNYEFVEEEVNQLSINERKTNILLELEELDKIISRIEEDIIKAINLPLHSSKQVVLDRKIALRNELANL